MREENFRHGHPHIIIQFSFVGVPYYSTRTVCLNALDWIQFCGNAEHGGGFLFGVDRNVFEKLRCRLDETGDWTVG